MKAKPEPRARSARELRSKPESKAKPKIERGGGPGEGLSEPLPRNFLKMHTMKPCNLVYSSSENRFFLSGESRNLPKMDTGPSQIFG